MAKVTSRDLEEFGRQHPNVRVLVGAGHVKFFNPLWSHLKEVGTVQPRDEVGLAEVMKWANKNKFNIVSRGGGHSYPGSSRSDGGIVIDSSQFVASADAMKDQAQKTGFVTVGAGNKLKDVYDALAKIGHVVPAGTADTVGMGAPLGGLYGDLSPQFGMTSDNLVGAKLVTYDGRILDISDAGINEFNVKEKKWEKFQPPPAVPGQKQISGADYMKVLRGGGQAGVGHVTALTFKAHDVSNHHLEYFKTHINLSKSQAAAMVDRWQQWQNRHPDYAKAISTKLDIFPDGGMDIKGAIATNDRALVAKIKSSMGEFLGGARLNFEVKPNMASLYEAYRDKDELLKSKAERTVASAMITKDMHKDAVSHIINNMPSNSSLTFYSGGGAMTAPDRLPSVLPAAKALVELEVKNRSQAASVVNIKNKFKILADEKYDYANYHDGRSPIVKDPGLVRQYQQFAGYDPELVRSHTAEIVRRQSPAPSPQPASVPMAGASPVAKNQPVKTASATGGLWGSTKKPDDGIKVNGEGPPFDRGKGSAPVKAAGASPETAKKSADNPEDPPKRWYQTKPT